ncbi:MAG TPA: response regulator transcription factor [Bacteroidales bacterium]
MMSTKIKVFIVDDHDIFRDGIKLLLSSGDIAEVVGEACNGQEFLDKVELNMPDVVLMDIAMPVLDGIETSQKVREKYETLKILALTMFGDEKYYCKMIQAGAKGFVLKSSGISELIKAITEVNNGRSYFSNELLVKLIAGITSQREKKNEENNDNISKRELEVLRLIAHGHTNEEIADKLNIGTNTVRTHRANLAAKTGCGNTASLVMYAIKNKYVEIN